MRKRTRTVLRWSAGSVAAALFVLAVPISAVALPYPLFGYKMQQGSCVVYSDAEFDEDFGEVLTEVNRRLESVAVSTPGGIPRPDLRTASRSSSTTTPGLQEAAWHGYTTAPSYWWNT